MDNYRTPGSRRRNPLLRLIVLLCVLGGIGFLAYNYHGTTITMHSHPTVVVESCPGFVHIRASQSLDTVTIEGFASILIPRSYNERRNQVIITGCNLVISVPVITDLIISASSINVFGVQGQMTLDTNGGEITIEHSILQGKSVIKNNGGSTRFEGSLAPGSTSTLDSNGGLIDLTLPHNSAFHLDVTGIIDTITTNFLGVRVQDGVHVDVGHSPTATLIVDTNGSPIVLNGV